MKRFIAMVLALVMALSLVACGGDNDKLTEKKVVGTWTSKEPMYLEHYGCETLDTWTFNTDHTYTYLKVRADSAELLFTSVGAWIIDSDGVLRASAEKNKGDFTVSCPFEYNSGELVNGDVIYVKQK